MSDFNDFDDKNYPRTEDSQFSGIVDRAISRRGFLGLGAAFGVSAFIGGVGGLTQTAQAKAINELMGFQNIPMTTADTITLPKGYSWKNLISWGDPLFKSGVPFNQETRGTGASQELAFGDNNDGMSLFQISENHGVFVVNNEYVNRDIISPAGINTEDDVRKGKAGHGVSVFEVKLTDGKWVPQVDAKLNRRITADTPMLITGPAAGNDLLKTAADATGTESLGTWNNCGNGRTPWGTYLACEENFNGYFASTDETFDGGPKNKRYGVGNKDWGYNWFKFDERFDISKHPNEPHRAGYIVEIDPMDPTSKPKKRTALGRFKHENAEVVVAKDGRIVVYLGDDERGEFLYRYISNGKYVEGDNSANQNLLDDGTLYVAKFGEADDNLTGSGEWIELTHGKNGLTKEAGFDSQAEVLIFARMAGSTVGATTMDRPEWVAANPNKVEAYCALTNNKNRGKKPNAGGDETPVAGPNPREGNLYGQIVRWTPADEDHASHNFNWDLFVLAGNPAVHQDNRKGSSNITPDNMFNSPDGIIFDKAGRLWIQTDGNYSSKENFAGMGNNQMLCGDPESGEIRRFMVGPIACEVTGAAWSDDGRTMFVGIQHPGEKKNPSHFPDGGDSVPRSSIVAITKDDGGVIGS